MIKYLLIENMHRGIWEYPEIIIITIIVFFIAISLFVLPLFDNEGKIVYGLIDCFIDNKRIKKEKK